PDDPDFAPETFTYMYQTSLYQSMRSSTIRNLQLLRENIDNIPGETKSSAIQVLEMEKSIIERFRLISKRKIPAMRIRCHGDYHLGQVLYTGKDFVIIDFEGEPARELSERRLKRSPLRDVAGMIRSFHYAVHNVYLSQLPLTPRTKRSSELLRNWAHYWYMWVSSAFLDSYLELIKPSGLLPDDPEKIKILLDAYLIEKAIYEIGYELNNRPEWLKVPIQGIINLMESLTAE
ncbi:alpha-amylase, partial [Chloroflexota bacterium]